MNRARCLAGWLVVACGAAVGPPAVPSAEATCPAFDIERTPLGVMGLAAGSRLTAADREAILKGGVVPGVPVGVWPPHGPAPLRVGVIWFLRPEDPSGHRARCRGRRRAGDRRHARRDVRVHVRAARPVPVGPPGAGPGGSVTTYPSPVTVVTPAAFEAELQGRWGTFREAVRRGDLQAALECVHSARRARVEPAVRALLRGDVERALPLLRFVELQVADAVFAPVTPPPKDAMPLGVHFFMDFDGVWRLGVFGDHGDRTTP